MDEPLLPAGVFPLGFYNKENGRQTLGDLVFDC